jgi:hypothetical protein
VRRGCEGWSEEEEGGVKRNGREIEGGEG